MFTSNFIKAHHPEQVQQPQEQQIPQEENSYFEKMNDFIQEESMLQSDKRTVLGFDVKDSEEMVQVKSQLKDLKNALFGEIPLNDEENRADSLQTFQNSLDTITGNYSSTIEACDNYINKNNSPWTKQGKSRLQMVKRMKHLLEGELSQFAFAATRIFNSPENQGNLFWINVLCEVRSVKITSTKENTKIVGECSSKVYMVKNGAKHVFFKKEDALIPPEEKIQKDFVLDEPEDEYLKKAKAAFCSLAKNPETFHMLQVLFVEVKENMELPFSATMVHTLTLTAEMSSLKKEHCDFSQPSVQKYIKAYGIEIRRLCTVHGIAAKTGIELNSKISTRNVASSRLAQMLGMGDLIAKSVSADLFTENGEIIHGNAMEEARGVSWAEQKNVDYSPEGLRAATNLFLLDMISAQTDRNRGNIFVETTINEKNKTVVKGFQGIDNDFCFGKMTFNELNHSEEDNFGFDKLPPLQYSENENGTVVKKLNIAGIDMTLVHNLNALTDEMIEYNFIDLLSEAEINALKNRIHSVRDILNEEIRKNPDICYEGAWNEKSLERKAELLENPLNNKYAYKFDYYK